MNGHARFLSNYVNRRFFDIDALCQKCTVMLLHIVQKPPFPWDNSYMDDKLSDAHEYLVNARDGLQAAYEIMRVITPDSVKGLRVSEDLEYPCPTLAEHDEYAVRAVFGMIREVLRMASVCRGTLGIIFDHPPFMIGTPGSNGTWEDLIDGLDDVISRLNKARRKLAKLDSIEQAILD